MKNNGNFNFGTIFKKSFPLKKGGFKISKKLKKNQKPLCFFLKKWRNKIDVGGGPHPSFAGI